MVRSPVTTRQVSKRRPLPQGSQSPLFCSAPPWRKAKKNPGGEARVFYCLRWRLASAERSARSEEQGLTDRRAHGLFLERLGDQIGRFGPVPGQQALGICGDEDHRDAADG